MRITCTDCKYSNGMKEHCDMDFYIINIEYAIRCPFFTLQEGDAESE